ncbi:MAG TPA: hypothetical protein VF939_08655 [Puia sp.]
MKKIILAGSICFATIMLGVAGCSKQSEDVLSAKSGAGGCDTTSVKYTADIVPILQSNCYECHGNGTSSGSGGILLQGYSHLAPWAGNGTLAGCVTHAPGYVPMPYLLPRLSDCDINKIVAWVHQGALNN